jgi:hypothetical protein
VIVYSFHVAGDPGDSGKDWARYDGPDAGEALGHWTAAILDGEEYVTLEALREDIPGPERRTARDARAATQSTRTDLRRS